MRLDSILTAGPAAATAFVLVAAACSSSTSAPPSSDGGAASTSSDATSDAAPSGPCVTDTKHVAKDESGVCCPGLFKACVGATAGDQSPCICSTVACGTADMQPPPNVPCCASAIASDCSTSVGAAKPTTTCHCGP